MYYTTETGIFLRTNGSLLTLPTRTGARAVDSRVPRVYQGGQSLKLSTKAVAFKRATLLIGGEGASMPIGGARTPWPLLSAGPASNAAIIALSGLGN